MPDTKHQKLVPAHPPSKADPAAILAGIIALLAGLAGLQLSDYLTAEQVLAIGGGIVAVAGAIRTRSQMKAAVTPPTSGAQGGPR